MTSFEVIPCLVEVVPRALMPLGRMKVLERMLRSCSAEQEVSSEL